MALAGLTPQVIASARTAATDKDLRMRRTLPWDASLAGRSRQWLGAVPAAGVWAALQSSR